MKTLFKLSLAAACVSLFTVSCQKELQTPGIEDQSSPHLTTITCTFPSMNDQNGTKVTLDASGKTGWEEGDKIAIYGLRRTDQSDNTTMIDPVIHTLTAAEVINPQQAVFQEDLSSLQPDPDGHDPYNAAYPADDWSYYSDWYSSARARFTKTNQLLLAGGVAADGTMTMYNLCGAISFILPNTIDFDSYVFYGNDGTETVGYEKYLVEVNKSTPNFLAKLGTATYGTIDPLTSISGPVVCDGATLNQIFIPNEVTFEHGFTIAFYKGGTISKLIKSKAALTLTHGHLVNLGLLPTDKMKDYVAPTEHDSAIDITNATDLSATASANCYIVNANDTANQDKVFKFKAVKGNGNVSVGSVESAVILWETYNNAESVAANSVISQVDYDLHNDECYIVFKMPSTLHAGNAVIAAKNGAGEILWSWHIWVPSTAVTDIDNGIHTTAMMSRNLGALVDAVASSTDIIDITSIGMFYQWGRKDPFVNPREIIEGDYPSKAKVSGVERTADKIQVTLQESIQNPTLFARGYYDGDTQKNPDWCSEANADYWGDNGGKSIYDPCPPGYRVPKRDKTKALWADDITTQEGWQYDKDHYWFTLGSPAAVFPAVGWLDGGSIKTTFRTGIWNAHSDSWTNDYGFSHYAGYARRVYWESSSIKHKNSSVNKSLGYAVRCCVE